MRGRFLLVVLAGVVIPTAGCGSENALLNAVVNEVLADALVNRFVPEELLPADSIIDPIVTEEIIPEDAVTITLINDSPEFPIRVTVAFDDEIAPLAFFSRGDERTFLIEAGESVSFWEDCDDIRVVSVDDADLLIPDRTNEGTESALLNQGLDYGCGDEIRFRFDHSDRIRDFDVNVRILGEGGDSRQSLQDAILDLFGG